MSRKPGRDRRYSIALEYCGYPQARHVARFCGEWLGQAVTRREAIELTLVHAHTRRIVMGGQTQ